MNDLNIEKIKAAAQAVMDISNDVSGGFNAVAEYMAAAGPVETLALIELYEKTVTAATAERDTARQQAATLRAALAAVFDTDDLIALKVLKASYQHSGATAVLKRSHEKIVSAIDVLIATHPENKS